MRQITFPPNFTGWRSAARTVLQKGIPPDAIVWQELLADEPALPIFEEDEPGSADTAPAHENTQVHVPRAFFPLAETAACHRDPRRWALLYTILWRLTHGEPHLLEIVSDPIMHDLQRMQKAVRHDLHKMRAFVRFREVRHEGAVWFVAWFEPEHHIVEANAPFFRDRFFAMRWSILTPERCVHWDGHALSFTAGVPKSEAPSEDRVEALWLNYYSHIFNPARVKTRAMQAEMPKKYWKNLPEAAVIPSLLHAAPRRVGAMIARGGATPEPVLHPIEIPERPTLNKLRAAAAHCTACPLYKNATQTVFGEGPAKARLVFVGEQPGDQEDRDGQPFIGPAGQLFNRALAEAGIQREEVYVTNAVKHFKWEPRGKRRLHAKPSGVESTACRPWVVAELDLLRPRVLVLLGATAAQSLVGPQIRVLRDRGRPMASDYCAHTLVTVHPSSLLRAPDEAARETGFADFVRDLKLAKKLAQKEDSTD